MNFLRKANLNLVKEPENIKSVLWKKDLVADSKPHSVQNIIRFNGTHG